MEAIMSNGRFSGNPKSEWITEAGEDRRMRLLEEFWYEDAQGNRWSAPVGSLIDGASIPAPLWSVVGSPYTGEYRRASIVHDIACEDPNIPREQADKMFYFACLAGGCPVLQAQLLYAGVRIGAWVPGVRFWSDSAAQQPLVMRGLVEPTITDQSIQTTFREIAVDIESRSDTLSFQDLERLVDKHLEAKARQ